MAKLKANSSKMVFLNAFSQINYSVYSGLNRLGFNYTTSQGGGCIAVSEYSGSITFLNAFAPATIRIPWKIGKYCFLLPMDFSKGYYDVDGEWHSESAKAYTTVSNSYCVSVFPNECLRFTYEIDCDQSMSTIMEDEELQAMQ